MTARPAPAKQKTTARPARRRARRARLRRRSFIVNRLAQFRFAFKLMVHMASFYVVAGILTHRHVSKLLKMVRDIPASNDVEVSALVAEIGTMKGRFYIAAFAFSLLAAGAVTVIGVLTSHRLNGPVLRLKRYLAESASRPTESLKFRKTDRLDDLAETLNQTAIAVEQRRQEVSAILDQLAAQAKQLARASSPDAAQALVEEMEEHLRRLTALMESAGQAEESS